MAITNGKELTKVQDDARVWYNSTRQWLIDMLTEDAPSGTVSLTPQEQFARYQSSGPAGLAAMEARFMNLYRGYPDMHSRVSAQMARYISRMNQIGTLIRQGSPEVNGGQIV